MRNWSSRHPNGKVKQATRSRRQRTSVTGIREHVQFSGHVRPSNGRDQRRPSKVSWESSWRNFRYFTIIALVNLHSWFEEQTYVSNSSRKSLSNSSRISFKLLTNLF